jgi:hypothetical protein
MLVVVVVVVPVLVAWWIENKEQQTGYRLVKTKRKTDGGSTHSLKRLTPRFLVFYLHCRWQSVVVWEPEEHGGECKVKSVLLRRSCSLEGKIWWLNKCNFVTELPSWTSVQSRNSLLGEQMQLCDRITKLNKCSKEMQIEIKIKAKRRTQRTSGKTLQWSSLRGWGTNRNPIF